MTIIKTYLFLFFLVAISFCSHSQFGGEVEVTGSAHVATDAHPVDIDGDGDLDVISTSKWDGKVAWYENEGNGVFGRQWVISLLECAPNDLETADIDGDGDLDIVVTCTGWTVNSIIEQDKIFWIENLGNNEWGPKQLIYSSYCQPLALDLSDIDGDLDIDILFASFDCDAATWIENLGGGTFATPIELASTVNGASDVATGDMDGDTDLDVVAISYNSDRLVWYENLGSGSFGPQQLIANGLNGAKSVFLSDLNNSGSSDIIVASELSDKLSWFENLGGSFGAEQVLSTNVINAASVCTGDLDNDGDQDIYAGGINSSGINTGFLYYYENLGAGTFGAEQTTGVFNHILSLTSADIDGDGNLDILGAISASDTRVSWLKNLGGLTLGSENRISGNAWKPLGVENSDLDGDGDLDVIAACGNGIAWFENLGNTTYSARKNIHFQLGFSAVNVEPVDIDDDGDNDVFYTSTMGYEVGWCENLGGGIFNTPQIISTGQLQDPRGIHVADIDDDGLKDVLVASRFDATVSLFRNVGGSNFGPQIIISSSANGASSVFAADLDGDLDLDIVSGNTLADEVAWYENLGNNTFGPLQSLTTIAEDVRSIRTADLDNDGDQDILAVSSTDNKLSWHENLGGGSFSIQQLISSSAHGAQKFDVADLDGDGDLDVVCALWDGHRVTWYENLGSGNFGGENLVTNLSQASAICLGDMDGDGDIDITSASFLRGKIVSTKNGQFSTTQASGELYVDINQNQLRDSSEVGIPYLGVLSTPQSDFAYTYSNGSYFINFSDTLGTYIVEPQMTPQYWSISTDSLFYTVQIDSFYTNRDSLDFGVYPDTIVNEIQTSLIGGFPRCNWIVNYTLNIENIGTTVPSGVMYLQLDDSLTFVGSDIIPDSIIGQNIYWSYDSLDYFAFEQMTVQVEMPDFYSIDDTITSYLSAYVDSMDTILYSTVDTLNQVVDCAYDPNDKTAFPSGVDSLGYIWPQPNVIEYLIRFQNTGTDTAFRVVIKDEIDDHLILNSLDFLSSSHPVSIEVDEDREVSFIFDNIMLPDSNVNELLSHGYIHYRIGVKPNLVVGDQIFNTAHILFDFNPAVITNTVIHTLDDEVGIIETSTKISDVLIYPNPFDDKVTIVLSDALFNVVTLEVYDISGHLLLTEGNFTDSSMTLDLNELESGMYFIRGMDDFGRELFVEKVLAR